MSIKNVFKMSKSLGLLNSNAHRTHMYVLSKSTEELGELSQEIQIENGLSYKEKGKDGIRGEAVDLAITALDNFALTCGDMPESEMESLFYQIMQTKLNKWQKNSTTKDSTEKVGSLAYKKQQFNVSSGDIQLLQVEAYSSGKLSTKYSDSVMKFIDENLLYSYSYSLLSDIDYSLVCIFCNDENVDAIKKHLSTNLSVYYDDEPQVQIIVHTKVKDRHLLISNVDLSCSKFEMELKKFNTPMFFAGSCCDDVNFISLAASTLYHHVPLNIDSTDDFIEYESLYCNKNKSWVQNVPREQELQLVLDIIKVFSVIGVNFFELNERSTTINAIMNDDLFAISLQCDYMSEKFYIINVDKNKKTLTISYGKVGTKGQTTLKHFGDTAKLQKELIKILKDKAKKHYTLVY